MSKPVIALDARLVGTQSTGDATYWRGLIHGLMRASPNAHFLLFSNAPRPKIVPAHSSFEWIRLPSLHSRWWSLVRFPLAARKRKASVIHTQYNLSPLAGDVGVTTIHDVSFLIGPEWFKPRDRMLLTQFVGGSMDRAKRVITVSKSSLKDISRFYPKQKSKIRVTPLACGFGVEPFEPGLAANIVKRELGIERPFLLTVGTRWPRKNMQLAIDAVAGLPDEFPHRLAVTGKSGWGEESAHGRIVPTGYVTDNQLSALYSAADLYLAPSHYEGFGLTLLEAFHCGCPVLCSEAGGAHKEVAGNAAKILSKGDAETWRSAVLELLSDSSKLADLRLRGVDRVAEFSWIKTAELTWKVYQEVMNDR